MQVTPLLLPEIPRSGDCVQYLTLHYRKRKLKCDRSWPCSQCQKSRRDCKYACSDMEGGSDGSENELPERPVKQRRFVSSGLYAESIAPSQPNGAASSTGRGNAPMEDIAARLDRLERLLTENNYSLPSNKRRGPSRRPHYPHVPAPAVTIRALSLQERMRSRYFGQYSTKVLLNLVRNPPCKYYPGCSMS